MFQSQSLAEKQNQRQLQDQTLSFDNMMKLVSTFEQISHKVQGIRNQKTFHSQDFYNYEWKNLQELENQAWVQMYSFATSKWIFDMTYGPNAFQYLRTMPKKTLQGYLQTFQRNFKTSGLNKSSEMIDDLKSILNGRAQQIMNKVSSQLNGQSGTLHATSNKKPGSLQLFIGAMEKSSGHTETIGNNLDENQWIEGQIDSPQKIESQKIINSQQTLQGKEDFKPVDENPIKGEEPSDPPLRQEQVTKFFPVIHLVEEDHQQITQKQEIIIDGNIQQDQNSQTSLQNGGRKKWEWIDSNSKKQQLKSKCKGDIDKIMDDHKIANLIYRKCSEKYQFTKKVNPKLINLKEIIQKVEDEAYESYKQFKNDLKKVWKIVDSEMHTFPNLGQSQSCSDLTSVKKEPQSTRSLKSRNLSLKTHQL